MAFSLIEGFDDGLAFDNWNFSGGVVGDIDAAYGRHGKGVRLGDTPANYLQATLPEAYLYCAVGFAAYIVDYGGTVAQLWYADTNYCLIMIDETANRIGVKVGLLGSIWADANSLLPNSWHYIEFKCFLDNTAGFYELKVDGTTLLSDTNVDTYVNTSYLIDECRFGNTVDDVYLDDIWFQADHSEVFLKGDIEVVTLLPSGNGTSSGMTGSDGNQVDNYLLVDNNAAIPPATTEYVGSATEGDKDTYVMEDLTGTPTVLAVQTTLYAEMTDTGPKSIRPVIRSGGTDYPGTTAALQNSVYIPITEIWETDPDTAAAWTYGGVNSMEFGQEVRDS